MIPVCSDTIHFEFALDIKVLHAPVCSGCGQVHNTPIHSTGMVVIEDLAISGKRVFLHVPKRKYVCIEDGRISRRNMGSGLEISEMLCYYNVQWPDLYA